MHNLLNPFTLIYFLLLVSPLVGQEITQNDLNEFEYRNIGPANQGGRITDIEAVKSDFTKVFIAVASGGVWKSENAGTTWKPIFDDYETASIGDIALDPSDPETIWVGTGEANNRNSVSWGNGIYKSSDGGETFQNMGLESTHQIARVLVNPSDPDDVCVCAIGHLWGYSGERGLFQTKDGGKKWKKLTGGLPNDGKTGCTDLLRDSKNPNTLYTAFYHRLRKPWTFESGGEKGGIFKSDDNGKTWKELKSGLPQGPTGRIGLAIYEKNPKILMALVEAEKTDTLGIPGSGVYRSEDGGDTWKYTNTYNNRPFYYSQIRINPHDDQRVYLLTTRFMVSEDGGTNLRNGSADYEVHGDYHALWHDPLNQNRYYLGADKGLSLTHDHGENFTLIDNLPIAQFYRINYDMQDPYYVYGGLQDNGSYATASFARDARGILSDVNWKMHWGDGQDAAINPSDWTDGYSSMEKGSFFKYNPKTRDIRRISPSSLNTINHWDYFTPDGTTENSTARYNWSAPLQMSPHNPSTIYVGGNHVFRSMDKGTTWTTISPDLSTNDPVKKKQGSSGGITPDNSGAENHCAIIGLSISPIDEDVIWVCTDDGNVQKTYDGGGQWTNVRNKITGPQDGVWGSRIITSKFSTQRAYVSFDGHRSDEFGTWLFVTDDAGESWRKITNGFSKGETIRVIIEDHQNENLLFAGTETGVWFSLDRGENWSRLKLNMPTVSVYDMKIHPRDNDLLVGTHGRSLWILDDISPLQQWSKALNARSLHLFDQKANTLWNNISRGGQRGHFLFAGDNPKTIIQKSNLPRASSYNLAAITYFVSKGVKDSLTLEISEIGSSRKKTLKLGTEPGIHRIYWNREFDADEFSIGEKEELNKILDQYKEAFPNRRVRTMIDGIRKCESTEEIRSRLTALTQAYLSIKINPKFLVPLAQVGTYGLTLSSDNMVSKNILQIRDDPMNKADID